MTNPQSVALKRIRRSRLIILAAGIALIVIAEGPLPPLIAGMGVDAETANFMGVAGTLLVLVAALAALSRLKCPRCSLPFFQKTGGGGFLRMRLFSRACLNCQLPLRE